MRSLPGSTTLELSSRPADRGNGRETSSGRARGAAERSSGSERLQAPPSPQAARRGSCALRLYVVRRRAAARRARRRRRWSGTALALTDVRLGTPTLEDVFIDLTGQDARDERTATLADAGPPSQRRAFLAVLRRDLYVTWGELPVFLAQVILQPLFLLFVFGKVLGSLGYTRPRLRRSAVPGAARADRRGHGHADARVPARHRVRLDEGDRGPPARADVDRASSRPRRCCSPALRALIATAVMIPIGILVLGSIPWRWSGAAAVP